VLRASATWLRIDPHRLYNGRLGEEGGTRGPSSPADGPDGPDGLSVCNDRRRGAAALRLGMLSRVVIVLGLAFLGLIPVPERIVAPGLLTGARRRGSGALLGGAFAVCAAPCIGTVLAASILASVLIPSQRKD